MPKICVALNTNSWDKAFEMVEILKGEVDVFKVGLPLYLTENGRSNTERLIQNGLSVFLDLKLHDIPSVVAKTVETLPAVDYLTVHLLGGSEMLKAAVETRPDIKILGVSILTSLPKEESREVLRRSRKGLILSLSRIAMEGGAWGIVVPGDGLARIVRRYFKFISIAVPGIRMRRKPDDHKWVTHPKSLTWLKDEDMIIVGREITNSKNPLNTLRRLKSHFQR